MSSTECHETPGKIRAAVSFTGGKDCTWAMHQVDFDIVALVVFHPPNPQFKAHKIQFQQVQATEAMGMPLSMYTVDASQTEGDYRQAYALALKQMQAEHNVSHIVTGDIDYVGTMTTNFMTSVCEELVPELQVVLPLWQQDRESLLLQMIPHMEIVIACAKTPLDASWVGHRLTEASIPLLKELGIDLTGEKGEYHTMVLHAPRFRKRLCLVNAHVIELTDQKGQKEGEQWWVFGEDTRLQAIESSLDCIIL
eukprot:Skav235763  [mRNA]  locus=scaffold803:534670:535425:+ [translate_table: standard]